MNTRNTIFTIIGIAVAAFLLYNSVYFTTLSERTQSLEAQAFNPSQTIAAFWKEVPGKLQDEALSIETFDRQLSQQAEQLAKQHGKTLGIGAPYSFLVKGTAEIAKVKDETIILRIDSPIAYSVRTGYIFSNTVREASGSFDIDRFETTMDFNLVAIEINHRIVNEVIAPVKSQLIAGNTIQFLGAADIDLRGLPVKSIEIIPIQLQIIHP